MTNLRSSLIEGIDVNGDLVTIKSSLDGKLSVNLPMTVFGELVTAEPTPVIQKNFVYGEPREWETISATGGSVTFADNFTVCQTGTSVGGYGVSRSKRSQVYKAGEATGFKFTAIFDSDNALALSRQTAGALNLTDSVCFGYDGTSFGTLHEYGGKAEVQTLTVSAGASGNESLTITIAGTEYTVAVTSGTAAFNAYEIADDLNTNVPGWRFDQVGATVECQSESAAATTNDFTLVNDTGGGTCAGTFAQNTAGAATTKTWTPQSSWNSATLIGGDGGFTLDPSKLNVYKIDFGYLGVAGIRYYVMNPDTLEFILVHLEKFSNANIQTIFYNPSQKIGWVAASLGSSGTNLTVKGASCEASVGGKRQLQVKSDAHEVSQTGMGSTETVALMIKNRFIYGNKPNLGEILIVSLSVATDQTKGGVFKVYLNPTVTGTTNFQEQNTNGIALYEESQNTVSGGELLDSVVLGSSGNAAINVASSAIYLVPESYIVVTYASLGGGGASDDVEVVITWKEDV